jgi:hypothetical protein
MNGLKQVAQSENKMTKKKVSNILFYFEKTREVGKSRGAREEACEKAMVADCSPTVYILRPIEWSVLHTVL